jgi:hypothetical protein
VAHISEWTTYFLATLFPTLLTIDEKPVDDKEMENIVALDEGDIALLKTYASATIFYYLLFSCSPPKEIRPPIRT